MLTVDLHNLGYKFVSRYERSKRHPSIQWLGTVEDSGGLSGALILNSDGNYCMCPSRHRAVKLDAMEVLDALARPVRRNSPGRPALHGERMQARMVTLPADLVHVAFELGEGNVSEGVRIALRRSTP